MKFKIELSIKIDLHVESYGLYINGKLTFIRDWNEIR